MKQSGRISELASDAIDDITRMDRHWRQQGSAGAQAVFGSHRALVRVARSVGIDARDLQNYLEAGDPGLVEGAVAALRQLATRHDLIYTCTPAGDDGADVKMEWYIAQNDVNYKENTEPKKGEWTKAFTKKELCNAMGVTRPVLNGLGEAVDGYGKRWRVNVAHPMASKYRESLKEAGYLCSETECNAEAKERDTKR